MTPIVRSKSFGRQHELRARHITGLHWTQCGRVFLDPPTVRNSGVVTCRDCQSGTQRSEAIRDRDKAALLDIIERDHPERILKWLRALAKNPTPA